MFVNMRKEVLDNENKVVERNAVSFDLETTTPALIEYFIGRGYEIVGYSDNRRA